MEASILIVSKNRKEALSKTLKILEGYIDSKKHEIRVFLDGCTDDSDTLKHHFKRVHWRSSGKSLGASKARNILYKEAKGTILYGFDDDAHPLQSDFIKISESLFRENPSSGILGFKEIKGTFETDAHIPQKLLIAKPEFLVNDFIGCGFAIQKKVYDDTRGFPTWIDIYGEEVCVAMEVLDMGYNILFTHKIQVNHRVDREQRKLAGANYFRFGKQLKNTAYFYMVYYPFPLLLKKIIRLYFLNFKKYALKDRKFFQQFWNAFFVAALSTGKVLKERQPVKKATLENFNNLSKPLY